MEHEADVEALAADLGVELFQQFEAGETTYEFAGEVLREGEFYARYADQLAGVERLLREIDSMAATVAVEAPWLAPEADRWDRVTVGAWYDSHGLSPVARELARALHGGNSRRSDRRGVASRAALQRPGVRCHS
jgi:hypothetical protein